jgi:predicted NAD/FAD-binding protein
MNPPDPAHPRIAVIGSGAAGITAAHLLQRIARVTLYEKNDRLGGHTHTVEIPDGPDAGIGIDTGFIVMNDRTYPLLHRLLDELECPVRFSDMSFGFASEKTGLTYAGTSFSGLFAQRRNLLRPSFYRFLNEILRFGRQALADLEADRVGEVTLAEYTRTLSPATVRDYVVPMAAAIWSATQRDILAFPARTLLHFWRNHGLLSVRNRPRWQTVTGGSHAYLKAFSRSFCGTIRLRADLRAVRRTPDHVVLRHAGGEEETYDQVVIATHADEALALLEPPTTDEMRLLGTWRYQVNRTLLHTDPSFMPASRRAWASWNYVDRRDVLPDTPVPVTYHMNRLMGLDTFDDYFVTLNPDHEPAPGTLVRDLTYHHPVYALDAVATQPKLAGLQGVKRTWFCGSYFGYGFHEDAVRSGVEVARGLGVDW